MIISAEIYRIATRLANEGKTPSVALIKANLGQPLPLAQVIKGLQNWQSNPELGNVEAKEKVEPLNESEIDNDLAKIIENATRPLVQRIEQLEAKLETLERQLLNK